MTSGQCGTHWRAWRGRGRRQWGRAILAGVAVCAGAASSASAQTETFSFSYVTGSATPVGGVRPAGRAPAFHEGVVAFCGYPVGSPFEGIYTLPLGGSLNVVARRNEPIPGGGGTFSSLLAPPTIRDGRVAFHAFTSLGRAIYSNAGGTLQLVAGPSPGARWGMRPTLDGGVVSYSSSTSGVFATAVHVWTPGGGSQVVVSAGDPHPTQPQSFLGDMTVAPVVRGNRVAFIAYGYPGALYTSNFDGTGITALARYGDPAPGGGEWNSMSQYLLAMDGGAVAFQGGTPAVQGLYTNLGGVWRALADTTTPIPGGTGNFTSFDVSTTEISLSAGLIAFSAIGAGGQKGIYGDFGQGLERVISVGQSLEGREVTDLLFGRDGLSGSQLAFTAFFTDGSSAIYVANVPAPGAVAMLALVGAGVSRRATRRRVG